MSDELTVPVNRELSDAEITIAVAKAILDNRQNPGSDLPFSPSELELLARLGIPHGDRHQRILSNNRNLDFRLAEYCWRLVGLGFLVPQMSGTYGQFRPTTRGRAFLEGMDASALTTGTIDAKLDALGYAYTDLPRQYGRLAHDCFLAGHHESSVVMLGVASESLIGALAEALSRVQKRVLPNASPRPSPSNASKDLAWLGATIATHQKMLRKELQAVSADVQWIEPLRNFLSGTAQAIRLFRNDLGHPTGVSASQEDALQLFALFPKFADAATKATNALSAL